MPVLALDFDGVLCDSAYETGATAWRACGAIWAELGGSLPPPELIDAFRLARPAIETGHQAILLMRLLYDGVAPGELLARFVEHEPLVQAKTGRDVAALKRLFGRTRDRWLAEAPDEWVALSPLYPGVAEWLRTWTPVDEGYIVTTKAQRFVARLLSAHGVVFPLERIHGLDSGRPKEATLAHLLERHPSETVCFVEDRLATLIRCRARAELDRVQMRLAGWGYNTEAERRQAEQHAIPVWTLTELLRSLDQESQS